MCTTLVSKYNVPGPRYTSYPTVPFWETDRFQPSAWMESVQRSFRQSNSEEGISIYIHLPFCESLCTFCGCHKRITKNHSVEIPYLEAVVREWELYGALFDETPVIKELHLGGGTPTFFSAENLSLLLNGIFKNAIIAPDAQLSFEGHPNNTTIEHLEVLAHNGFDRVSYGVQDYNPTVQQAINRLQPFQKVKTATENARKTGYTSVGHDIIFGLPFQKKEHVLHTIERTLELRPDRIAFYSYAHVPWIKGNGQRGFKDDDLPTAAEKRAQYEMGRERLLQAGYAEIGMDHFALPSEPLYEAQQSGKLHRNFMGYTHSKTQLMIGLGASAIGDSWLGFAQNEKQVERYLELVAQDMIPVFRGHLLTHEDLVIRQHILNLMCTLKTSWKPEELQFEDLPKALVGLQEMVEDQLVQIDKHSLQITEKGRPFVRNICMAFDRRLQRKRPQTQLFSMTV
ncbi:MAG: oxygen-independent coproporphyrinogen III oxidase [Bacteroidota bacterium]